MFQVRCKIQRGFLKLLETPLRTPLLELSAFLTELQAHLHGFRQLLRHFCPAIHGYGFPERCEIWQTSNNSHTFMAACMAQTTSPCHYIITSRYWYTFLQGYMRVGYSPQYIYIYGITVTSFEISIYLATIVTAKVTLVNGMHKIL